MQYINGFVAILESDHSFLFCFLWRIQIIYTYNAAWASNFLLAPRGSYPYTSCRNHKLASSVVGHELGVR